MNYKDNQEYLDEWAASRETSMEVAEAILYVSTTNRSIDDIWNDPTHDEALAVWERATKNGLIDDVEMQWGDFTLQQVMKGFL